MKISGKRLCTGLVLDGKLEAGGRNLGTTTIQVYDDRMKREKRAMTKSRTVSARGLTKDEAIKLWQEEKMVKIKAERKHNLATWRLMALNTR